MIYQSEEFFSEFNRLRQSFVERARGRRASSGASGLNYIFCGDEYQYMSAVAIKFVPEDLIEQLTAQVVRFASGWSETTLSTTPQLRVFIGPCKRSMASDKINAKWHWVLPLVCTGLSESLQVAQRPPVGLLRGRVLRYAAETVPIEMNRMLIHDAALAYAVPRKRRSMDPCHAFAYIDGYLH